FNWPVPRDNSGNALLTSFSATPQNSTCLTSTVGVTCRLASISNGASEVIAIDATATSFAHVTTITSNVGSNVATAGAMETSIATATVSITGIPGTDIQLTDNGSTGTVAVGGTDTITYTLVVTNAGPNDVAGANKLTLDETFPTDFVYDAGTSTLD